MTPFFRTRFAHLAVVLVSAGTSACSVLVGNIKPVDEKSKDYRIMQLDARDSDWKKIDMTERSAEESEDGAALSESSEIADSAFQSQSKSSIISINSGCRSSVPERDLREFSQQLLLGMSNITERSESMIQVSGQPALLTTVQGEMSGTSVKIRTVVVKKNECAYDLVYVAHPEDFSFHEQVFSDFVYSLVIK